MARAHFRDSLLGSTSPPRLLVGATVAVYDEGTTTPIAQTLYAAASGGTTKANPITTGSDGLVEFWLDERRRVDLAITHPDTTPLTVTVEVDGDPAEDVTETATQTVGGAKTYTSPTLSAPTIVGGSISGTVSGGTLSGTTLSGGTVDANSEVLAPIKAGAVTILEALASSTVLRSQDGTKTATLTNGGLFTAPGLLRPLGVYILTDHGFLEGANSTNAANNTTVMQTVWGLMAQEGGGTMEVPDGAEFPLDPTTLDHQQGFTIPMSIRGRGGSLLKLYGTSGNFLDISPSSSSPIARCGIEGLYILHADTVTSGATIRLGYTSRFIMDKVNVMANGAFVALGLIGPASVHAMNCTLTCRNAANAASVVLAQTVATGGVQFTSCDLSGDSAVAIASKVTRGLRFSNSALVDTIILNNTSLKDHQIQIASTAATGDIQNFMMNGGILDFCQYGISFQPSTGADYGTMHFTGVWMSAENQIAVLSTVNGGTVTGVTMTGGSWHNATQGGIAINGGVVLTRLNGINMGLATTNNASYSGVLLQTSGSSPSRTTINACAIQVGASTAACITAPSGASPITVVGNDLKGGADSDGLAIAGTVGTGGTARTVAANTYEA